MLCVGKQRAKAPAHDLFFPLLPSTGFAELEYGEYRFLHIAGLKKQEDVGH